MPIAKIKMSTFRGGKLKLGTIGEGGTGNRNKKQGLTLGAAQQTLEIRIYGWNRL